MTTMTTPVTNPNVTRSRLVLEIASEMTGGAVADAVPDYILPKVVLRHAHGGRPVTLFGISSAEGIFAVASREIDLAMINPAAVLSWRCAARASSRSLCRSGRSPSFRPGMHSFSLSGPKPG